MKRIGLIAAALLMLLAPLSAPATAAQLAMFTATVTGTGGTSSFSVPPNQNVGVFLKGGTATIQLEESPDGANWYKVVAAGSNQMYVWTIAADNQADTLTGVSKGMSFRFNCTAYTSNVAIAVLAQ